MNTFNYITSYWRLLSLALIALFVLTACSGGGEKQTPLIAPTNLKVVETGSKLKLSWSAHSKASAYNLYYAEQSFSGIDIANYQSLTGAKLLVDISGTQKELNAIDFKGNTTYYFVLSAKTSSQQSGKSNEQSIKISPSFLNDTGISKCGNYAYGTTATTNKPRNNNRDCTETTDADNYPIPQGQDGHYGTGKDGSQGKKLTKVASFEGKCVQDEHTGLMWEVKQTTGLHSKKHSYTWYNPDSTNNGGGAGTESDGSSCSLSKCNTQAFVKGVNKIGLCGYKDWRLPTIAELQSIVDSSRFDPSVDPTYFPHTKESRPGTTLVYWSSSPSASGNGDAWGVSFATGSDYFNSKHLKRRVRLVRAMDQ